MWNNEIERIDNSLAEYQIEGIEHPAIEPKIITHITEMETSSMKQQFQLLSTISNFQHLQYPSLSSTRKKKATAQESLRYMDHILYDPTGRTSKDGLPTRKYIPSSPRNKCIYLANAEESEGGLYKIIKHLIYLDSLQQVTASLPDEISGTELELPDEPDQPPPPKKRKHTPKIVSANATDLCNSVGIDYNTSLNSAKQNRKLYITFKEQLISDGAIKWRLHERHLDICAMNDINPTTGLLLPNSFVHVTCKRHTNEESLVTCSCDIYRLIQRSANSSVDILPGEDIVLDGALTCMHCRFFIENLTNIHNNCNTQGQSQSKILEIVKSSFQYMNDEVQLLGSVLAKGSTKFSVKGESEGTYGIISITFPHNKCYAKCHNGTCKARMQNRKKIPKQFRVSSATHLCSHIRTLHKHIDYVKSFFPQYFQQGSEFETENPHNNLQEDNVEDVGLKNSLSSSFDKETGLWDYKALSKHKPYEMMNENLIFYTNERNENVAAQKMNQNTGLYKGIDLKPSAFSENGDPLNCHCGSQYGSTATYINTGQAILYTRNGPMSCTFGDLRCGEGKCVKTFQTEAQKKGIFFYTSQTCAGDEIGWDFISLVMKTKISFTAYCNEKTRVYTTTNPLSANFMSPNTFIGWFFGWLSAFKIDFRKHIDPWCGYKPEVLACDGTHIGVSLKNLDLNNAVTGPDTEEMLVARHQRMDRLIIRDNDCRKHLRYMCNKYLGKLPPEKILADQEEGAMSIHLINYVRLHGDTAFVTVLETFLQQTQDKEFLHSLARTLHMLSGIDAMSTVLPRQSHETILLACQNIQDPVRLEKYLEKLRKYTVDTADLIKLSVKYDCTEITRDFLHLIISKIEAIHSVNREPPVTREQPNTYYPPGGAAYYFTPHGNKIRQMPKYSVKGSSKSKNYDDCPPGHEQCRKYYPNVSFGGYSYMFLWFCPIHGHSYGFHLIDSGEGRKDVFSSLYKYIETPPKHIFYDNACQLNEYCMNREPEFFLNTQFWHDLFHSIGHICGFNFRSGRVIGLEGVNTEICEQVNSFLQSIKYTASHLTQEHFMFFVQFFLYILNKNKTESHRKQATIALAGHL